MHAMQPVSPFIEGTYIQYAWDSTSIGLLKTCARLYYYIIICGYQPKSESIHLRYGMEVHAALQDFDNFIAQGFSFESALRETVRNLLTRTEDWVVDESAKPGQYKNRTTLLELIVDYLDYYRDDAAETVILESGRPAVEMSFRFELDWGPVPDQPYILAGHLDKVVEFAGERFVKDYKTTTTTISSYYFKQYEPHNQMTLYSLAGRIALGTEIRGVMIDGMQILLEKPHRFVRDMTYRTQDQLDEWLVDLEYHLNQAEAYARAQYWPMNDMSCDKFGGCRFREVCSKSPAVREQFLTADFHQLPPEERWNPLKSR